MVQVELPGVTLRFLDRQIGKFILQGLSTKEIALPLDISDGTVNRRIARMCRRAGVVDRPELTLWLFQNPHSLDAGALTPAGLHPGDCQCSPFCRDLHARMRA